MRKILFACAVLTILMTNTAIAQKVLRGEQASKIVPNSEIIRLKEFSKIPNYVRFKKGKEISLDKLPSWLGQFYNTKEDLGLRLIKKEIGKLGMSHYRYQQTINGVPAELSMFIVHVKDGKVISMNGELFSEVSSLPNASLSESAALNKALQHIGANVYKWQLESEEKHLKWEQNDPTASYYPKGKLVMINQDGKIQNDLSLAYKFNIYAQQPLSRREIYVSATTGHIIWQQDLIHEADVTGTATTVYSGTQTITCDNSSGPFRLQETGRGNGVRTFTNNNTTTYSNTDITNTSATWTTPHAGLDAHWGAEMTYDYFWNNHGRNSIDGAGFQLNSYVNHGSGYSNAFWDGSRMTYGDGSGNSNPFTAIDIAGHEVTHGLTSNTANLVYSYESGALNESFSDIFGISIDILNRPGHPNANWVLGDDLSLSIRDMANPNALGDPDTYLGTFWHTSAADNGGVHVNSGVQNFWYVLLVEGGIGTNDNSDAYVVDSIGMTKAAEVAFRNLTVYLTVTSQYDDARFFAIQSAVDLFGNCSFEVEQVTNAWYAVGVGPAYVAGVISDFDAPSLTSCAIPFNVNFNNLSANGTTYFWDFGDGNTSTLNNPTHTYTMNGNYTVQLIADGGLCGIDTIVRTSYIAINTPADPAPINDTICTTGVANLSATGTGTLNWYTAPTGGSSINTGTSYNTPVLSSTTTYYVNNSIVAPTQIMGKADTVGGGAIFNFNQHLKFDAFVDMEIISVQVYAGVAGNRTFELRDNSGTPLQSVVINLATGLQTINLNFSVPAGTDYQLGVANSTANLDLFRNNNNVNYPYNLAGIASITRSSAGTNGGLNHYYFFYNWTVKEQDCMSARVPVTAFIDSNYNLAAPQVSLTHPICSAGLGSILITSPLGNGLEYSIDGTNYQTATIFDTLAGSYAVTARTTYGCLSAPTSAVLNPNSSPCEPNITLGATSSTSSIQVGGSSTINFRINNLGTLPTTDTIQVTIGKPTDGTLVLNLPAGWTIVTNNPAIVQIQTTNIIQPGFANSVIIPGVYTHSGLPSSALKNSILLANPGSGGENNSNDNNSGIFIQVN